MAHIRPFKAWRYNADTVPDIARMFSPLFDVVSPGQLQELYTIPGNSIFLSVPRSHAEAVGLLRDWKENHILSQDPLPAIYVYYQRFSLFGESREYVRKGFVCMIRVDENSGGPDSDIVLHEDTIASSVEERTQLLEKTLLNTAPTHGLYEDPDFELEPLMDAYMQHPLYEYIDYQGVINQMAIVQDKKDVDVFIRHLAQKKVYLADGHHRLASSVQLMKQRTAEGLDTNSMVHYHLMYLTNLSADDLRILPIHRVVTFAEPVRDFSALLKKFERRFTIEDVTHHRATLAEELKGSHRAFGMDAGNHQYLLRLRSDADPVRDIPLPLPDAVKELVYTQLHYFVFDEIFGMPYREHRTFREISYVKDYGLAVKAARENPHAIAFITPDLSMDDMMSVCRTGALMPQKSTYFYPKVVCGLVFASINDDENNSPFDTCFWLPTAQEPAR